VSSDVTDSGFGRIFTFELSTALTPLDRTDTGSTTTPGNTLESSSTALMDETESGD